MFGLHALTLASEKKKGEKRRIKEKKKKGVHTSFDVVLADNSFYIILLYVNFLSLHLKQIHASIMDKINRLIVMLVEKENTVKRLADQLGKSICTISKWCSNTTQPNLYTLNKVA